MTSEYFAVYIIDSAFISPLNDMNFCFLCVSQYGLAVRHLAGKQKDLGSIRFGSPFSSVQKLCVMDTVL